MKLYWDDPQNIALALMEAHPEVEDPLDVRFTDLYQWIIELEDFADDPQAVSEGKLEAIQMAWYEEVSE
ncbi:MAG: Fe-S cluster assembly protein IscX [Anaerolineae bacterium]